MRKSTLNFFCILFVPQLSKPDINGLSSAQKRFWCQHSKVLPLDLPCWHLVDCPVGLETWTAADRGSGQDYHIFSHQRGSTRASYWFLGRKQIDSG
ncbi:hypothetical protein BRADI_3g48754v3 [Brachypodium distachyon]|uniref:Uncharacterized protein n=1 Tax=Brachypodium distachyon TaxID=15368 RepID=A0A2K2D447_BRADI|nr:hypothetical protein BRADI_3g48754v3 [Brachypodium distachyon]